MGYCPPEEQLFSAPHNPMKNVQLQADFKSNDISGLSRPGSVLRNPASSFTGKWSHLLRFRDGTKKMDSDIRDTVQLFKMLERPIGQTGRYE
jgi:hypothetical protein